MSEVKKEKKLRDLLLEEIKRKSIEELMEIVGYTCSDCKDLTHHDVFGWGCKKNYRVDTCFKTACEDIEFKEYIKKKQEIIKNKKDPFDVIVPKDFWKNILNKDSEIDDYLLKEVIKNE